MRALILAICVGLLACVALGANNVFENYHRLVINDTDGGSLTGAAVSGQVYTNTGSTGGQTHDLPAATAGMHVTFVLTSTSGSDDWNINPDNADQILVLTDAAGDAISSDGAQGSRIELVAIDATNWVVVESAGTWSDAN